MYYKPFHFFAFLYRFDKNWLLFFINAILVVIGYWIANTAREAYTILKYGRIALLIFSIYHLRSSLAPLSYLVAGSYKYVVPVLGLLFLPSIILSAHPLPDLVRLAGIMIFLYYIELFFRTLAATQPTGYQHILFIEILRFIYFLPILIYVVNTPELTEPNIYGQDREELGLTSNNFGWAASIYFLLTIDRIKNYPHKLWLLLVDLLTLPLAIYLVIISGSRSSVLAIVAGIILIILFRKGISLLTKAAITIGLVISYFIITSSQDLAVNRKISREGRVNTNREARLIIWNDIFSIQKQRPAILFFGVGPENSREAINRIKNRFYTIHPHNTYIIILFEGGMFCFTWFLIFFIVKPLFQYARQDIVHFSYTVHPFIISFFDHNFGPGQFMAFPLFSLIFFYLYQSSAKIPLTDIPLASPQN